MQKLTVSSPRKQKRGKPTEFNLLFNTPSQACKTQWQVDPQHNGLCMTLLVGVTKLV